MAAKENPQKILVIRPDRIGDVLLSTPVLRSLRNDPRGFRISFLIQPTIAPLIEGLDCVDEVLSFEPEGRHNGILGFQTLLKEISDGAFDAAIALFSHNRIATALVAARIPKRIGPLSKPHSFLCYNEGLRQHRSRVEKHEAQYNLDLLAPLQVAPTTEGTEIFLSDDEKKAANVWLKQQGYVAGEAPLVVIHPGMGGSALNWPTENFIQLAEGLAQAKLKVLITGGPGEAELVLRFQNRLGHGSVYYYGAQPEDSISRLAGLMSQAKMVVAPSTGPLHIAVALKIPTVSFYPTIRVQSEKRWGPFRPKAFSKVFSSANLDQLSVSSVLKEITGYFDAKKN